MNKRDLEYICEFMAHGLIPEQVEDLRHFITIEEKDCPFMQDPFKYGTIGCSLAIHISFTTVGPMATVMCSCGAKKSLDERVNW